jgi:hypothetical protein
MNDALFNWHLRKGLEAGKDRTCGSKNAFKIEDQALKAEQYHNKWPMRNHDVEAYPCVFCGLWHIGGVMEGDDKPQL